MITREKLVELLLYNPITGEFFWRFSIKGHIKKGNRAGSKDRRGYWMINLDNKYYLQHRLAWFYIYNRWPQGEIDHINLQRDDNRIDNLREATHGQNQHNSKSYKNNSHGVKGITKHKYKGVWTGQWVASIQRNKKHYYLGIFNSAKDAHAAYCKAAETFYGEFARTQ